MSTYLPEKVKHLDALKACGFNVPEFVYVPASDFEENDLEAIEAFLGAHRENYKIIARSAHPQEDAFKGGTFDSMSTYADIGGILYARKRMIKMAMTDKRLSILRQQKFNSSPQIDPEDMGVLVMPFIEGSSVMAKKIGEHWEFGYCRNPLHKIQTEPFITSTPHDRKLIDLSDNIQKCLGFPCEIEYIISEENEIYVVQAKNISAFEWLEQRESDRTVHLDGIRRIRKRRNYRERPVFVMDNQAFYISLIGQCEDMILGCSGPVPTISDILNTIKNHGEKLENFALKYQRFAVLGLSIRVPDELYQVANHYLDDTPEKQQSLSKALYNHLYIIDRFLGEADTIIAKERVHVKLCSHDAYGIDTVRNPIWMVYWHFTNHQQTVRHFKRLGFKTGDTIGIEIDAREKPLVYRL
ncbi:MAG: hypothetical protein AB7S77_04740 [Desulfatirhabdiaceae bacterium]